MTKQPQWELTERVLDDTAPEGQCGLMLTDEGMLTFFFHPPEDLKQTVSDVHLLLTGAAALLCSSGGRDVLRQAAHAALSGQG